MNTLTLFRAYERVVSLRASARSARHQLRGIAIDTDYWAKKYQHRDRQARKLGLAIEERLGGEHLKACYLCGFYESACTCEIGFRPRR